MKMGPSFGDLSKDERMPLVSAGHKFTHKPYLYIDLQHTPCLRFLKNPPNQTGSGFHFLEGTT